jgi:protein-disulfide isomerase
MKDKAVPILVVAIVVASFVVGMLYGKVSVYEKGAVAGTGAQQPAGDAAAIPDQAPEEPVLSDEQWKKLASADAPSMGKSNAKITMVEFTDYQCPFCSRYVSETKAQIIKEYIDTGKIAYKLFDLPLPFHDKAKAAALAARCAGDQNKYWEMHDVLFEKQAEWGATGDATVFAGYAKNIGLNGNTFSQCFDSGKYDQAIEDDLALAGEVGASGTPTFFINGERLVGAQPFSEFKRVLDAQLN